MFWRGLIGGMIRRMIGMIILEGDDWRDDWEDDWEDYFGGG